MCLPDVIAEDTIGRSVINLQWSALSRQLDFANILENVQYDSRNMEVTVKIDFHFCNYINCLIYPRSF